MENPFLGIIGKALVGASIVIGGVAIGANAIINQAKSAVDAVNVRQLANALELYHLDRQYYPPVQDGELIDLLSHEGYIIKNAPDPTRIKYESYDNGQRYTLSIDQQEFYIGNEFDGPTVSATE
jgi:hypothetical protein